MENSIIALPKKNMKVFIAKVKTIYTTSELQRPCKCYFEMRNGRYLEYDEMCYTRQAG